jgi:hypothetical protein
MQLVKIGQVILNFDRVNAVRDPGGSGAITVEFASGPHLEVLAHADSLRAWLGANLAATTIPPGSSPDGSPGYVSGPHPSTDPA